jgi:hypothetical protein
MRRVIVAVIAFLSLLASRADAVTIRDLIELSNAGLSDQVLVALIEVDRSVYTLDAATLKQLKDAGVSDAVIIALIRNGRSEAATAPAEPIVEPQPAPTSDPQPQVVVIDHHDPVVQQVPVAVPVAVPVFVSPRRAHAAQINGDVFVPANVPPLNRDHSTVVFPDAKPRCVQPIYWGFGGKLRPGSWQPPSACR